MASAAPSPLAGSTETTNGTKLRRLLVDGGGLVLRKIFDGYHPPGKLAADLHSHCSTLDDLFARRILSNDQKQLLFPPDRSNPNSKNFDISLLFLLLTEICGLSPPHKTWSNKPHAKNKSEAANIVRIKLFRNKLLHTPETRIDTRMFTQLWKEISGVLASLGLGQAEINRLKTEPCGEDYIDILFKWADREKDIKLKLDEVHQDQKKTHQTLEKVFQTQRDQQVLLQDTKETIQVDLQEIKQSMSSLKEEQKREREEETLQSLAKCDFKADIQCYVGRFQEGTREWVFNKVENWLNDKKSQNRVMVICGNAGMGKSVISAVVCQRMLEAGRLSGCHFIQHNNVRYRKPQLMLQSLAYQMCCVHPEFKLALVDQLRRNTGNDLNDMGVEELFALLFKEPLSNVEDRDENMLIVIDGLDESDYQERNELLDVIAKHFCKLPPWIRFLVTSRPERNITEALKHLRPFQLESNDEQNMIDIKNFIKERVKRIREVENTDNIVEKLAEKSEGLMLYAYFLLLYIEENPSVLKQGDVEGSLPLEISSVYRSYFKRLENELCTERLGIKEDNFLNLLSTVAASREPLPIDFVSQVLVAGTNSMAPRRKVLKAIRSVSSLLPVRGDRLHVFHKSVKDWLTDECCYGKHDFIVDEKEGHRILAELCTDEMDIIIQRGVSKGVNVTQFSDKAKYALEHGVRHMLELEGDAKIWSSEEVVKKYVVNLELVYAKLCVNSTVATEDIFCVLKHDGFNSLSRETKRVLETLLSLIRRNSWVLRELPNVFLQTVVNEGGTELSFEAKKLLREKYVEIPFMECTNKKKQEAVIEARFDCSAKVACFDVSPREDYMVCECADQTIQLWSLKTGIREWTNPVLVKKEYSIGAYYDRPVEPSTIPGINPFLENEAKYRPLSFYRSVVFHPNGKYVLPGNLSRVYTIDGKQTQLSTSDCKFSVCIFLANKTMMLTNCVDNSKCLVMWNLDTGEESFRITRNEDIVCFQCSPDETRLAISHSTGLICLLDLENDLTELGTISTSPCGLMNFSTENPVLVGVYMCDELQRLFCWSITPENLFQEVHKVRNEVDIENAFLLGDATADRSVSAEVSRIIPCGETGLLVQLNNERALMSSPNLSYVSILNLAELRDAKLESETFFEEITFSTNGEIIYVVSKVPRCMRDSQATVTLWDCSSGNFKQEKFSRLMSLVPVKDGVVILMEKVELWDVELSECKQCWEDLEGICEVVSISEEQVACHGDNTVIVLSSSGDWLKTIEHDNKWEILAISKKQQRLAIRIYPSCNDLLSTFRIWNASSYIEICSTALEVNSRIMPGGLFSPNGEFCVIWDSSLVEVYNAASGKLHCELFRMSDILHCKFITNKELIVCSREFHGNFLRMFDVRSGEHLNTLEIEERPVLLGVCPYSLRIAVHVGPHVSDVNLIQVHLPQGKGQSQE